MLDSEYFEIIDPIVVQCSYQIDGITVTKKSSVIQCQHQSKCHRGLTCMFFHPQNELQKFLTNNPTQETMDPNQFISPGQPTIKTEFYYRGRKIHKLSFPEYCQHKKCYSFCPLTHDPDQLRWYYRDEHPYRVTNYDYHDN